MNKTSNTEKDRIKLILCYANVFTLCFSVLYSLLLFWGYINKSFENTRSELFPIYLAIIIPIIFTISYILNLRNKTSSSKLILIPTILILNLIAGIWWGFDLPSLIISYIFCIVVLALTSKPKENIIYISVLIFSIFLGHYIRKNLEIKTSWYGSGFYINDIIEFSIMFIFISFLLIKFNNEQNKTLKRALRVENILKKERDELALIVEQKTKEIKQIQMDEISKMYHLIEFGKLSSGLYHDLITPIQTMNLYIEKLTKDHLIHDDKFSKVIINIKKTHDKLSLMLQNIRKQITLRTEDEEFNIIQEMQDIIDLVKNNYFKNGVNIIFEYKDNVQNIISKKSILNHILLNIISNAYEACKQDKEINNKSSYVIQISIGKHDNKNYISITDNGIGIKIENIKKIFDDFYSSKKENNCGVGLSSAKHYLQKYLNGKIFVESEINIGTTFTVLF